MAIFHGKPNFRGFAAGGPGLPGDLAPATRHREAMVTVMLLGAVRPARPRCRVTHYESNEGHIRLRLRLLWVVKWRGASMRRTAEVIGMIESATK